MPQNAFFLRFYNVVVAQKCQKGSCWSKNHFFRPKITVFQKLRFPIRHKTIAYKWPEQVPAYPTLLYFKNAKKKKNYFFCLKNQCCLKNQSETDFLNRQISKFDSRVLCEKVSATSPIIKKSPCTPSSNSQSAQIYH